MAQYTIAFLSFLSIVAAQQHYTTPVSILKQINRHNDDGSYSFGYESADGSFKIETKYPNGEVYGKYGYIDDSGKKREVEYGASRRGFEPQGSDINVPPPTLVNNNVDSKGSNEEDDGQYREDPSKYYKGNNYNTKPVVATNFKLSNSPQIHNNAPPQYNPTIYHNAVAPNNPNEIQYNQIPKNVAQPHHNFYQSPIYQPYQSIQRYQPEPINYKHLLAPQNFHPSLQNFNIDTGSYTITYTGR